MTKFLNPQKKMNPNLPTPKKIPKSNQCFNSSQYFYNNLSYSCKKSQNHGNQTCYS